MNVIASFPRPTRSGTLRFVRVNVRRERGAADDRACRGRIEAPSRAFTAATVAFALFIALSAASPAVAQSIERTQRNAFLMHAGPAIGIMATGFHARLNGEFQLHRGRHFQGHALNLGIAVTWFTTEGGLAYEFAPRYQYDHQLVPGALLFVSPYVGANAGLGMFDLFTGSDVRPRMTAAAVAGIDMKLIVGDRLLIGFRPLGITVPFIFFDDPLVQADVWYEIALSIGTTY